MTTNLQLPGNPRYQPRELEEIFGYDQLYKHAIRVEFAALETLYELGLIPVDTFGLLTPELKEQIITGITTTMVDKVEREKTKHDVRALVQIIQSKLPKELRPYVHIPLTSYDVLDTARVLQFKEAFSTALEPGLKKLILIFISLIKDNSDKVQIGRTHGQHAVPITVGFWLATILDRLLRNYLKIKEAAEALPGKISGGVGAYNAQELFGLDSFEGLTLKKLNLETARISTQILPPEYLTDFLYACTLSSATLAQFGRDCRHLMRSEIGEVTEAFSTDQVGSSTMAHKRNPINFENLEGMWIKNKAEYLKVMDILISEHQRDLVNSSVMRDLPIIVINLQNQINTLLRVKDGQSFLERLTFNEESLKKNMEQSAPYIMAEPIYMALQLYGYQGDAHHLINHILLPKIKENKKTLVQQLSLEAETDKELREAYNNIPPAIKAGLEDPEKYLGRAQEKAIGVAYNTLTTMQRDLL